ncbi:unnamed protein product [Orchesella dallaii]|uniref:Uncharacterized protein n=1 Tax=Orchesella dallaii TaxID=48710 RepID=A0ABP1S0D2_9HEXA
MSLLTPKSNLHIQKIKRHYPSLLSETNKETSQAAYKPAVHIALPYYQSLPQAKSKININIWKELLQCRAPALKTAIQDLNIRYAHTISNTMKPTTVLQRPRKPTSVVDLILPDNTSVINVNVLLPSDKTFESPRAKDFGQDETVLQTDPTSGNLITLEGWLNIEVELVDKEDSIRMMYLQMYDEYFNAIGEFIKDPAGQCPPSDPEIFVSPTEFQYLPCSAIGAREAQPSQAVYMVDRKDLIDKSLNIKFIPLPPI